MINHLQRFLVISVLAAVSCQHGLLGQESPLKKAMLYPPRLVGTETSDLHLSVIDWKLAQLEFRVDQFFAQQEEYQEQQKEWENLLEETSKQIPAEQRVIDSQARSELAASILSDLIRVRLDAVANEVAINELGTLAKKVKSGANKIESINVEAAKLELDQAKKKYEKTKFMADRALAPKSEIDQLLFQVKVSQLKLEKAEAELEGASDQAGAQISERLVDLRIELKAAKSRIAAAEELLSSLAAAEATVVKLKNVQWELQGLRKASQQVAVLKEQAIQEMQQLKGLRKLISQRSSAKAADEESGQ